MTIYVRVQASACIEIDEAALAKAGLTMDDLYGYPTRLLDDKDVEYELSEPEWETTGAHDAVYQWPKPVTT